MTKAAPTSARLRSGRVQVLNSSVAQVAEAREPIDLCKRCEKAAASDDYEGYALAMVEAPTGKVHYELHAGTTICGTDSSDW